MSDKAFIVFWLDMDKGGCVVQTGVYSESHPTMHERSIIPVVQGVVSGRDFGEASVVAKRELERLERLYPKMRSSRPPEPATEVKHDNPVFYCGRCQQHIVHECQGPSGFDIEVTEPGSPEPE